MVSSIIPGAAGANALGVDLRYARTQTGLAPQTPSNQSRGDSVEIGDSAQWAAARESVRWGLVQLGEALAAGRDVYGLLSRVVGVAQAPDADGAAGDLNDAMAKLQKRVDAALAQ